MVQVNRIVLDDRVILYWDKPEGAEGEYVIFKDGAQVGRTVKTHFTIDGLLPETSCLLEMKQFSGEKELAGSGVVSICTAKSKKRIDVSKAPYFAVGDGKTMNTEALQRAMDDCDETSAVYIPQGVFLTGALRMHSHMELYLEEGARLQGTDDPEDYLPKIWSRFEGTELYCYSSLLNLGNLDHEDGYNCRDVVIRGKGTIAGGGVSLAKKIIRTERELQRSYLESLGDKLSECETPDTIPGRTRSRLINMSNCQDILLCGVTLRDGASWNVHMIYSDRIVTCGCSFFSRGIWNGDGWDPDSSTNCTIFNCDFYTEDDSVAIKSGKNPEGNRIARPTEHIRIFDCKCAFGHGLCIGSEMSGGVRDVRIWDCDMQHSMSGIEIKGTKKRGGYVRDVQVRNCKTARIMFHSVGYNDDGIGAKEPPVFENCSFEQIQIMGEYLDAEGEWQRCDAIELCGFDEPGYELKDIRFEHICLGEQGKTRGQRISMQLCEGISFRNVKCY